MYKTNRTDADYLTELSTLYEISSIPTSLVGHAELGRLVLDRATRLLGVPIALLYRCEGDDGSLRFWAARGVPVAEVESLSPKREPIARALDEGQLVTLEGVDAVRGLGVLPASYPARQGLCLPIRVGCSARALLWAFRLSDRPFTRTDLALFGVLADRTGTVLESIRLFAETERRNRELQREVEERRRAEAALARERDLLHALMDNIPDTIYFKDTASRFTRINKAQAEVLGVSDPEEAIGQTDSDFFTSEHAQDAFADEQGIVRSGEPLIDKVERIRRADGQFRWVSATKVPIMDEEGQVTAIVGISRDITERVRAEKALKEYSERLEEMVKERTQELRDAQEQLLRREKLAVLGQLAGGIAHDLRNPLGAISNAAYFLNLVLEEPGPEVKEMLEILNKEVRTSERIIRSLLDFARTKAPVRREVDLNAVVRRALTHADVPESVEVVSRLDEELPTIQADPDQLAQVFDNIIRNAVQAMAPAHAGEEGGQLTVKTERRGDSGGRPGWVTVCFTDTGVGIPEENLGKLLEPLFTTKAKGIGLGLALVKMLVEGHGGIIEVESEVGKGSTFTVHLPVTSEQ